MGPVLTRLLTSPVDSRPIASWEDWQARYDAAVLDVELPADRALLGGLVADRVAYAFAGGYQAALAQLVAGKLSGARDVRQSLPRDVRQSLPRDVRQSLPRDVRQSLPRTGKVSSLCITEEGGGHPRAVKATLTKVADGGFEVTGRKQWATGAPLADQLLVAVSTGLDEAGRNRLAMVVIDARAPGVTLEPMPEPPFAPELPHAVVKLAGVRVADADVLPGDGYDAYVKPFRTIEDAHVFLALVGHVVRGARLFGGAREGGARDVMELAVVTALALRAVAAMDASAAETHVALAGALDLGRRLLREAESIWSAAPDDVRARWERDRALAGVAERARSERRVRAWAALRASG